MVSSMVGQRFGRLVVEREAGRYQRKQVVWECRCDCGATTLARTSSLRGGHTRSCGCLKAGVAAGDSGVTKRVRSDRVDHTGQTFGRLTVVRYDGGAWLCRCECGAEAKASGGRLRSGNTRSCGCLQRATKRTHGLSKSPEYVAWVSMIQRCTVPTAQGYPLYGGRGITVCGQWADSFAAFLADMGRKPTAAHSLDRIDNAKGYEPGNCRWATASEQQRNKRNTRALTCRGVTRPMAEWAGITGIPKGTIKSRLRYGWTEERAVTEPIHKEGV